MGKKLRFPLKMEDEIEVRTLKELKDNFSLTKVLDYVSDGKLIIWLRDRSEDEIADAIEKLDSNSNEFPKQICEVFGINNVAFCQDDLYDLLDEQYDTIYLYGDKFEIPINRHNITYIGFNNPIVIVNSEDEVDWEERKISLSKVQFDDKYKKLLKYKKFVSQFKLTEEIQKTEVYTMYIEKIMEKIYDVAANHLSKEGLETLKDMLETYRYDETPDYIINAVAGVVGTSTDMEKNIDTLGKYFSNDKYDNVAELIQKIWNYYKATIYLYSYHKAPTEEKEMEVGMCLILLVYYQYEKQLPIIFKFVKLKNDVISSTGRRRRTAAEVKNETKDTTSDEDIVKEMAGKLDDVELTEEDVAEIGSYIANLMMNRYLQDVPEDKKEKFRDLMKESVMKEYKDHFEDAQLSSKTQTTRKPENKKTHTVSPTPSAKMSKQEPVSSIPLKSRISSAISKVGTGLSNKNTNASVSNKRTKTTNPNNVVDSSSISIEELPHDQFDADFPFRYYIGKVDGLDIRWDIRLEIGNPDYITVEDVMKTVYKNKELLKDQLYGKTAMESQTIYTNALLLDPSSGTIPEILITKDFLKVYNNRDEFIKDADRYIKNWTWDTEKWLNDHRAVI